MLYCNGRKICVFVVLVCVLFIGFIPFRITAAESGTIVQDFVSTSEGVKLTYPFLYGYGMLAVNSPENAFQLLKYIGVNQDALIFVMGASSPYYLGGFFFDEFGILRVGKFENPLGTRHASLYGVKHLSDLVLVGSSSYGMQSSSINYGNDLVFYDRSYARAFSGFESMDCFAFDFSGSAINVTDNGKPYLRVWYKPDSNSDFQTTPATSYYLAASEAQSLSFYNDYVPFRTNITWVYGDPVDDFTVLQSWDSSQIFSYSENGAADTFTVSEYGGSVLSVYTYQWYYSSSQGGEFYAMPAETSSSFIPKTTNEYIGTSVYFCRVTATYKDHTKFVDSGFLEVVVTEAPPPETEPTVPSVPSTPGGTTPDYSEKLDGIQDSLTDVGDKVEQLPDQITDGFEQLQEQEKEQASAEGDANAQQVIEIIPNPSADFLPAFENLASVMNYNGTAAVLSLPAVTIPAIAGVIPEINLMGAQQINFESFMGLIPDLIFTLVRALFDAALVLFCFKELIDLIGNVMTGFKNSKSND